MFERSEMTPSTKKEIKSTRQYQDFIADKHYAKCYKFITNQTNHIKIVIIAHKCKYLLLLLNSLNNHLTSVGRTEELKPWNHEKLSSELTLGVTCLMCSLCTRAWLLFYGLSLKGLGPLYLGGFWHSPRVIREGLTRFQAPSADDTVKTGSMGGLPLSLQDRMRAQASHFLRRKDSWTGVPPSGVVTDAVAAFSLSQTPTDFSKVAGQVSGSRPGQLAQVGTPQRKYVDSQPLVLDLYFNAFQ